MKKLKSHLVKLAVCLMVVLAVSPPITAFAADSIATTQVTIDDVGWQIVAGVVWEKVGMLSGGTTPDEAHRVGTDALVTLAGNNGDPGVGGSLLTSLDVATLDQDGYDNASTSKNLVLTFPGKIRSSWGNHLDSTENDKARADTIRDILVYDLNAAYSYVYEGKKPSSLTEYRDNMQYLLSAVSNAIHGNGLMMTDHTYYFRIATTDDISKFDDKTMNASDYVVITCGDEQEIFAYRMPKGYVEISGRDNAVDSSMDYTVSSSEDAAYITWGEYAYEAFATYVLSEKYGLTASEVYTTEPGALESMLVGLFSNLIDFISNTLGLWSIDELILNAGIRGGSTYVGGAFPSSWESIIWTFFYVMEVLALIVLSFAILAGIYKRAMSTVNPVMRASFMEQVKNICVAILILIMLPIIFRLMLSTSATLTEISSSALGETTAEERFAVFSKNSGTLGGCIMQLVYLCSLIYFNFFYYLRSLVIVALMVLSPILVMAYAIGDSWKGITTELFKVLVSSIFIQPIQALCLTLILILPVDGNSFQSIIAIYALIPLTNMLKDVVFKGSGNGLSAAAKRGGDNTTRHMKQAGFAAASGVMAAGGAIGGAVSDRISGGSQVEGSDTGGTSGGISDAKQNPQEEIKEEAKKPTTNMGSPLTASNAGTSSSSENPSFGTRMVDGFKTAGHVIAKGASFVGKVGKVPVGLAGGAVTAGVGGVLGAYGYKNNLKQVGKGVAAWGIAKKQPAAAQTTPLGGGNGDNGALDNPAIPSPAEVGLLGDVGMFRKYSSNDYYSSGNLTKTSDGYYASLQSREKNSEGKDLPSDTEALGMTVNSKYHGSEETGDQGADGKIQYDCSKLQPRSLANLEGTYQEYEKAKAEGTLDAFTAETGIVNMSKETRMDPKTKEEKITGYGVSVNKEQFANANGIDIDAKEHSKRCVKFSSQEIVPQASVFKGVATDPKNLEGERNQDTSGSTPGERSQTSFNEEN